MGNNLYSVTDFFHIKALLFAIVITVSGCVTNLPPASTSWQPRTLGCPDVGTTQIVDTNHRFEAKDFSILPPSDGIWCISIQQNYMVGFTTRKLLGEFVDSEPTLEVHAYKQLVGAESTKVTDIDISTPKAIKSFTEKWLTIGHPLKETGGQRYLQLSPTDWSKRFKLIQSKVQIDNTYDADCIRFDSNYLAQDTYNYPWDTDLDFSGIGCRHPSSSDTIVWIYYAEERRAGYQDPEFSTKAKLQVERTLLSLEFR